MVIALSMWLPAKSHSEFLKSPTSPNSHALPPTTTPHLLVPSTLPSTLYSPLTDSSAFWFSSDRFRGLNRCYPDNQDSFTLQKIPSKQYLSMWLEERVKISRRHLNPVSYRVCTWSWNVRQWLSPGNGCHLKNACPEEVLTPAPRRHPFCK